MQILYVTPEVAPYSGSGDLSEVSSALPRALQELGLKITVVAPLYKGVQPERYALARRIRKITVPLGGSSLEVGLLEGKFRNCDVSLLLIDHPESFDRDGYYGDARGPYPDNHRRFYLLARAALEAAVELGLQVDVVHASGWQTGFVPILLQLGLVPGLSGVKLVFSVPDASEAETLDAAALEDLGLGQQLFHPEGIEFHGRVSLLKAGVLYASRVISWSPSYLRELQTEEFGAGLEGLFRAQTGKMIGIRPGLDQAAWDPLGDHRLAERYDGDHLGGKEACKRALQAELNLPVRPQLPLLAMLGPLTDSRGIDLLIRSLPRILPLKLQLAVLGTPSPAAAGALADAAAANPQVLAYRPSLDHDGLHRALAGADAFLAPQRRDPSGLQVLRALRYGAVPLCRSVGGLRDTVVDLDPASETGNGICFGSFEEEALLTAVHRLLAAYSQRRIWLHLVRSAMRTGQSWDRSARATLEVYRQVLETGRP